MERLLKEGMTLLSLPVCHSLQAAHQSITALRCVKVADKCLQLSRVSCNTTLHHPELSHGFTLAAAQDVLHTAPLYVHVKEVCTLENATEALEITYITLYAHNGYYALGGHSWSPRVGAHDGDFEHLTIRLQAPSFACQVRGTLCVHAPVRTLVCMSFCCAMWACVCGR